MTQLDVDPRAALEVMRQVQELVNEELLSQIGRARAEGVSWKKIGSSKPISRQPHRSGYDQSLDAVLEPAATTELCESDLSSVAGGDPLLVGVARDLVRCCK